MVDELRCEELTLGNPDTNFATRYMAASAIHARLRQQPQCATRRTLAILEAALLDPSILEQRQALNLCREAANALATVLVACPDKEVTEAALVALRNTMQQGHGATHQAVAVALGSLPAAIGAPPSVKDAAPAIKQVRLEDLIASSGMQLAGPFAAAGRSLIAPLAASNRLLVIKLATADGSESGLWLEAAWCAALRNGLLDCPSDCHIPLPLSVDGCRAFRLEKLPTSVPVPHHQEKLAIAFVTRQDYFLYPNGDVGQKALPAEQCRAVLRRSARLLGWFAARGILHTAPIPLFHNRLQAERRQDNGLYDWQLGGRLDQWLASCRHPNFGASGLRDFEHLEIIKRPGPRLHWYLGMHFFSLLLVAGSCFRFREPGLVGFDRDGRPVDARRLFHAGQLRSCLASIFKGYHEGFAGGADCPPLPFAPEQLASRMIEEMGVDTHMAEVLRVRDQQDMSERQFADFLLVRGFAPAAARQMQRGADDIVIHSGPHLGGFNARISLPELTEASAAMAALCVLDRYLAAPGRRPRGRAC